MQRLARRVLCAAILTATALAVGACSGPMHWHTVRVESASQDRDPRDLVQEISSPLIDRLSGEGFECRVDYGHSLFHVACDRNDDEGIGQTTDTFIYVAYPNEQLEVEITIKTSQLSYHPFVRPSRPHFVRWRDTVLAVIDSLPDVSYTDYEVE